MSATMRRVLARLVCALIGHDLLIMSVGENSITACLRRCGMTPIVKEDTQ